MILFFIPSVIFNVVPVLLLIWAAANFLDAVFPHPSIYWEWDNGTENIHGEKMKFRLNVEDMAFPPGFKWGAATSAHQIEGDCVNNNWFHWENLQGNIKDDHRSGNACEHYNRFREDTSLLTEFGFNSYRFSIEWSKIEPTPGQIDKRVIAHYRAELDNLRNLGIEPMITLSYFTWPGWWDEKGGWEIEANIEDFVNFSRLIFKEFGYKCKYWCTINEPETVASGGWLLGTHPPGKQQWDMYPIVLRNMMIAHCEVYHTIKSLPYGDRSRVGIVKGMTQYDPYNQWSPFDVFTCWYMDHAMNDCILEFFKTGHFNFRLPTHIVKYYDETAPLSNDFIGLNYHSHKVISVNPFKFRKCISIKHSKQVIVSDSQEPIYAEGLYRAIVKLSTLKRPIYITETGIADDRDDRRSLFIRRYLFATLKAIRDGYDIRGFYYKNLLDCFEWSDGFTLQYGLYEVDPKTQKRSMKNGSKFLRDVIVHNRKLEKAITGTRDSWLSF